MTSGYCEELEEENPTVKKLISETMAVVSLLSEGESRGCADKVSFVRFIGFI